MESGEECSGLSWTCPGWLRPVAGAEEGTALPWRLKVSLLGPVEALEQWVLSRASRRDPGVRLSLEAGAEGES